MPIDHPVSSDAHASDVPVPVVPELEDDETVAPRPEEEIADAVRAEPDLDEHSSP